MSLHSSTVTAIGFSHSTWTPALAARMRVLGVHRIGKGEVDSIDDTETVVELVVRKRVFDLVPTFDLAPLGPVAAHNRREPRVTPGMSKCRYYGDLRDMSEPDHCVPNRLSRFAPSLRHLTC